MDFVFPAMKEFYESEIVKTTEICTREPVGKYVSNLCSQLQLSL